MTLNKSFNYLTKNIELPYSARIDLMQVLRKKFMCTITTLLEKNDLIELLN